MSVPVTGHDPHCHAPGRWARLRHRPHAIQKVRQVLNVIRDDVGDNALALELARHAQQSPRHDFGAKLREDAIAPDDDIRRACFVFKRQKDDAGRRARTLTADDETADRDGLPVRIVAEMSGLNAVAELLVEQFDWMGAQRQTLGNIVGIDLLRFCQDRKRDLTGR